MPAKKMRIVLMVALVLSLAGAMGAQVAQAAKLLHRGRNVIHIRCGGPARPVTLEVTGPRMTALPGPCVLVVRPNCPAGACRPCNVVVRVIHRFANQRPLQVILRPMGSHRRCNLTVRHIQRPVYANPCGPRPCASSCVKPCIKPRARPCNRPVRPVAHVPTLPGRPSWHHRPNRPNHPGWFNPTGPPAPPIPGPIVDPLPPGHGPGGNGDTAVLVPDHMEPNTNLPDTSGGTYLQPDHLAPNTNLPDLGSNSLTPGELAPGPGINQNNPTLGHGTPIIPN